MSSVVIVGGGVSINEGIAKDLWAKIKHMEIWSCNYAYRTMPYLPSTEIWVDKFFWRHNADEIQELKSKGVRLVARKNTMQRGREKDIEQYEASREPESYYGKDAINKKVIFHGSKGFCGTFALSYAVASSYDIIYILGYDYGTDKLSNKFTHYYQKELKVASTGVGNPIHYLQKDNKPNRGVNDYTVYLREQEVKIYNVSMISNIDALEKISYDKFFELIGTNEK